MPTHHPTPLGPTPTSPPREAPRGHRHPRREQGLTLLELLVVIAILGILANILIPALIQQVHKARAQRIISDFNFFRQCLHEYHLDTDRFPRDRGYGKAPPEMADYLKGRLSWRQPGAGIWYDWENWVRKDGTPRRPKTGVARGFSVRFDHRKHRLRQLIQTLYPEGQLVARGRKLIFVIEPAG